MGAEYRMPTEADFNELINNCTATFIDLQGNEFDKYEAQDGAIPKYNLIGIRFNGSRGNSIFVPASGYCYDAVLKNNYNRCRLWSSSLYSDSSMTANALFFTNIGRLSVSFCDRYYGHAVRGVK